MAEASIASAIAKIDGSTISERVGGLDDLKRLLSDRRGSSSPDSLGDDVFHKVFELIYKIVARQRPTLLKPTAAKTTRNTANSRLEVAAAALRLTVEVGASRIKFKTALSVLDHIVESLPLTDGSLCEPLKHDYLRSFRTLLEYAPHGEHMRSKQWQAYVDFALECLSTVLGDGTVRNLTMNGRERSATPGHDLSLSVGPSQKSSKSIVNDRATIAEEAVSSLKSLTSITNARLMPRAKVIVEGLQSYLEVAATGQEIAFETLNNLLVVSIVQDVTFTQKCFYEVAPIIRQMWSSRSAVLREQMIMTLFICRQLFVAPEGAWPVLLAEPLDLLLTKLLAEHYSRSDKDMLHFDDLEPLLASEEPPLRLKNFKPIRTSARAVNCWLTLEVISYLIAGLSHRQRPSDSNAEPGETPRKRRKVQSRLEEVVELTVLGNSQEKVAALQILVFVLEHLDMEETDSLGLSRLLLDLNNDDSNVQTWGLLLFARLAHEARHIKSAVSSIWTSIWEAARRAMSTIGTTRAACHALSSLIKCGVLGRSVTASLLDETLFGSGNSGPCLLTDTALILMLDMLRIGPFDNDRTFEAFSLKILGWLTMRWTLPSSLDRIHNAQVASHVQPNLLCAVCTAICGFTDVVTVVEDWSPVHPSLKAAMLASSNLDFTRYILATPGQSPSHEGFENNKSSARQLEVSTTNRLFKALVDALANQLRNFLMSCKAIASERSSNIGKDIVQIMTVASTVLSAICTYHDSHDLDPTRISALHEVHRFLTDVVSDHKNVMNRREIVSPICACVVAMHNQLYQNGHRTFPDVYRATIEFALDVARQGMATNILNDMSDFDLVDEDQWESQASQSNQAVPGDTLSRFDLPICQDTHELLARQMIQLTTAHQAAGSSGVLDSSAATVVFDEILALDPVMLVGARGAVYDFLALEPGMARGDALRLVERLGEVFLQHHVFERCEPVLCFCLQALKSLVDLWSSDTEDELATVAFDIYDWFLTTALGKGIASARVLGVLAGLLDVLLLKNVAYGGEDVPSPRTSLLKILEASDPASQHRMADKLSHVFGKYVLTQHEAIFEDIVGNLPSDPDHKEGIAVRLYIVSHLGARWHTVLRQATYHVFEAVAHVRATTKLAHECILRTCHTLNLEDPRQLFKLFSPQIFYTWLSQDSFSRMPVELFGYASQQEMVIDNVSELVGQLALRGMAYADDLARITNQNWNDLLATHFAKAEAYTLASETSVPKQDRLHDGSEKMVRKQLGSETYLRQLRQCLPDIIAQLVLSLQDDRGIEKALPGSALEFWQEMLDQSGQQALLPLAQQPCFRARCLGEELNYICLRLNLQQDSIWTPALLVYLFRQILDSAKPALGPMHACSIIRKIRVVISLAGSTAWEGYPLEMMLHTLRPYLTLFECAGDAMGVYRYLLHHGTSYLSARPSFIAGLGVTIFASLSSFIMLSQDTNTQQSHFLATISRAQEFRNFLKQFLASLRLKNATAGAIQAYKSITQHAGNITQAGNSAKSTSEGQLLYALLTDQCEGNPLLSSIHFELSLGILCRQFSPAPEYQDDILADDEDASRVLPVLVALLKNVEMERAFRIWASQVLGRGFIIRGLGTHFRGELQQPKVEVPVSKDGFKGFTDLSSYTSIVIRLVEMLWRSNHPATTALENTLQLIFSTLQNSKDPNILGPEVDQSIVQEMSFGELSCPTIPTPLALSLAHDQQQTAKTWASDRLTEISAAATSDPVLSFLQPLMHTVPEIADVLLPYAVHLTLLTELNTNQTFREKLSVSFSDVLGSTSPMSLPARPLVLRTLLYLRQCFHPTERNMAERNSWLDVDLSQAAVAASECEMWHEALLFLELHYSQAQLHTGRSSRRSLAMADNIPLEVVSKLYENVDDPDFFYGKHQTYDLQSVITKMRHEGANQKSLSFHSAMLDSQLRVDHRDASLGDVAWSTASTLSAANMQGISEAVKQHFECSDHHASSFASANHDQWDLQTRKDLMSSSKDMSSLFGSMHNISNRDNFLGHLDRLLFDAGKAIKCAVTDRNQLTQVYSNMAILAEARQIVGAASVESLSSACAVLDARNQKIKLAEFEILAPILASREAAFAAIRRNDRLQSFFSLDLRQALLFEFRVVRQSLEVASSYETPQFSLNRAMYLCELSNHAQKIGLKVDVATNYDLARTLWSHDEASTSIGILQDLKMRKDSANQAIAVMRSDILTDLGHKVAEARLEQPDEIIERYLSPAIQELHKPRTGPAASRVFHNFAAFCDMQLQDSDNLDDYSRISRIRERKYQEVRELEKMTRNSKSEQQKSKLKSHWLRAQNWLKLDEEEWNRVLGNRENLILQCLENYLQSMMASDDYPNDTLRFIALWLNQAESPAANAAVNKHLSSVPTIKFAPLVNQLTSRLLDFKDDFQKLLKDLMYRICSDHPFHSLYQLFATSKSKPPPGDEIAVARHTAANKLAERIRQHGTSSAVWTAVHNTCVALNKVAIEPLPEKHGKSDSKTLQLRKLEGGPSLEAQITKQTSKIPPPTMALALRRDRNYSNAPTSTSIKPELSVASGVSAPKIATIIASDGSRHKLLLKGGNDDLRQDAIMEQVFEQVSNLLKEHRTTRQRNLGIRTYKVIPLTKNSGIIEFVQNTIPLNDYLLPAHLRYYPKDYKSNRARKEVGEAQTKSHDQRVRAYQTVAANFHPVMRFFFMENFLDPDEWFYKRLNYSRSTAAVSILGHVLGLGDRHGHNILLDETTGEVVHIDLGVAFEAGRVLPVPEVVPFRLTRDLVDGMGLTGVEGVFRRCCNFTLEALRHDQEAIMTILDVLRYDPLYSWSISPLRLQRMQENNEQAAASMAAPSSSMLGNDTNPAHGVIAPRRDETEPSEADRALTVVAKKLGKALSVEATVNDLIRQATDERNLAVLYCGWAAYA